MQRSSGWQAINNCRNRTSCCNDAHTTTEWNFETYLEPPSNFRQRSRLICVADRVTRWCRLSSTPYLDTTASVEKGPREFPQTNPSRSIAIKQRVGRIWGGDNRYRYPTAEGGMGYTDQKSECLSAKGQTLLEPYSITDSSNQS